MMSETRLSMSPLRSTNRPGSVVPRWIAMTLTTSVGPGTRGSPWYVSGDVEDLEAAAARARQGIEPRVDPPPGGADAARRGEGVAQRVARAEPDQRPDIRLEPVRRDGADDGGQPRGGGAVGDCAREGGGAEERGEQQGGGAHSSLRP